MMGQQREFLAHLGIERWVPRQHATQIQPTESRWRDQVDDQVLMQVIEANFSVDATEVIVPVPETVVSESVAGEVPTIVHEVAVSASQQPFELQALVYGQAVLLIEASALSVAEQQLWQNIQHALSAQYHALRWPFMGLDLHEAKGMQSYLQGFLNRIAAQKTLIALGDLSQVLHVAQHLPSLQSMLENPLQKQQLWQQLKNHYS